MSISVQARGQRHQLRVIHPLLPKPFFFTFTDEAEARSYGQRLHALLERGIVPAELLVREHGTDDPLVTKLILDYVRTAPNLTPSDDRLLATMAPELRLLRVSAITYAWAEQYVRDCKTRHQHAPGTIRKRVGALARVLDWRIRTQELKGVANPLRLLPVGYSQYTDRDAAQLPEGRKARADVHRDRRLLVGEEAQIRPHLGELELLFDLALAGLRLREGYRLRVDQFDARLSVLRVEGSKAARGQRKPRTVPLTRELKAKLARHCLGRVGLMFPFWDGHPETMTKVTARLSYLFAKAFAAAGCKDLTEHDLRHEAACRWFEHRTGRGWTFSEIEVAKIMGWTDTKMALRYASLRGEDLARRLR